MSFFVLPLVDFGTLASGPKVLIHGDVGSLPSAYFAMGPNKDECISVRKS